jgi:hypothetical protein
MKRPTFFNKDPRQGNKHSKQAKVAPDGERERATVLVCHPAGSVRFETSSDLE